MRVPKFGAGEIEGVEPYLKDAIGRFCEREGIVNTDRHRLTELFLNSLKANSPILQQHQGVGVTEVIPEGRQLINRLCDILVRPDSNLYGAEHYKTAQDHVDQGGNVLLVQNHRSGADSLVMEAVIRRTFGDHCTDDWAYMSGHAVNLYAMPLLISSGLKRFPIFSVKYQNAAATGDLPMQDTGCDHQAMTQQNLKAMKALRQHTAQGGRMVVLYPEGGRGNNSMKRVQPETVCVAEVMAKSCHPLLVLPTYVDGATSILPVARNDNEYNQFIERCHTGSANMTIGSPVPYPDLVSFAEDETNINQYTEGGFSMDGSIQRSIIADVIAGRIADLAPSDDQRGPYGTKGLRSFVDSFRAAFITAP